jgi:hypothetical protein
MRGHQWLLIGDAINRLRRDPPWETRGVGGDNLPASIPPFLRVYDLPEKIVRNFYRHAPILLISY